MRDMNTQRPEETTDEYIACRVKEERARYIQIITILLTYGIAIQQRWPKDINEPKRQRTVYAMLTIKRHNDQLDPALSLEMESWKPQVSNS